ncbi:MAG: MFS transporter [Ktedonobacterales bacterium]
MRRGGNSTRTGLGERLAKSITYLRRFGALRRNARLYLISNTIQAVTAGAIAVLYTLFLSALGYNDTFIGVALFVGAVGGGLGILPANMLVKRYGWRAMLLLSDLIGGVAIAIQLLIPTPVVTLITMLGVGASVAIFLVLNTPFLTANSAPQDRTALFALTNALGFLGAVTGTLLGGFLPVWLATPAIAHSAPLLALQPLLVHNSQAQNYQLALLISGVIAVPSIWPAWLLRDAESDAPPSAAALTDASVSTIPWRERLAQWRATAVRVGRGVIGRFSASQVLVGFGAGLFFPYLSLYFVKELHATTAYYGAFSAALTVLLAVSSLASAPLADRFGRARVSVVAQVASLPFMIVCGAVPILLVVSVVYLARSLLMNITGAPLQALLMDAVPHEERIVASNVYNVSWQGAWAVGAGIGGGLISLGGYALPFYLAAICYSVSAALLAYWFWRH